MSLTAKQVAKIIMQTRRCHNRLAEALEAGDIERPTKCEHCGTEFDPDMEGKTQPEGHHEDFDDPLNVKWLCTSCHHSLHGEIRRQLREEENGKGQ